MSKLVKLAIIRKKDDEPCPFGLKIPYACKNAGTIMSKMAPVEVLGEEAAEDEIKAIVLANKELFLLEADGSRCPYAGKIFSEKDAVECNFGSTAPGVGQQTVEPSKFYSNVYENISYDGLYSYPMGWYGDNNISRNLYYGIYSNNANDVNDSSDKIHQDIIDAIEHAIMNEDSSFSGDVWYDVVEKGTKSLKEILNWDDYSSWGDFNQGELVDESPEEIINQLNHFRPGYGEMFKKWIIERQGIPPIILVETLDAGNLIGDGRGRVNMAVGLNIKELPYILLKETKDRGIHFKIKDGMVVK